MAQAEGNRRRGRLCNKLVNSRTKHINRLYPKLSRYSATLARIFSNSRLLFSPIVAAGPGQQGYTPAELANLNSQAVTTTGQQYKNASQAAGERISAAGGGNALLPSGTTAAVQGNIATQGAAQTADQLAKIRTDSANIGLQNWLSAAGVLSGAPNIFSPATSALGASTGVGQAAQSGNQQVFENQQQLAKESNWWQPLVGQALGGALDIATGGISGLVGAGGKALSQFTNSSEGMASLASPPGTIAGASPSSF